MRTPPREAAAGGRDARLHLPSGTETTCRVSELPDARRFGLAALAGEFGGACERL